MNVVRGVVLCLAFSCSKGSGSKDQPPVPDAVPLAAASDAAPVSVPLPDAAAMRPGQIEERFDRFTKETVIWLNDMDISLKDPKLTLSAMTKARVNLVGLYVTRIGPNSAYMECRSFEMLVDDKPLRFDREKTSWQGDPAGEVVVESLGVHMPSATFSKLAKAKRLDFRVCRDEFTLTAEQVGKLAEFARTAKILK